MSGPAPATMASTIPRPRTATSPSPMAPPTGPLPALPIAKTRRSQLDTSDEPIAPPPPPEESRPSSAASIRTIPTPTTPGRSGMRSTSGLPTPKPSKSRTAPAVPTLSTQDIDVGSEPASAATPPIPNSTTIPPGGKTIRKTSSYGAFPLPPKVATRVSSLPPSPLSAAASLTEMNAQKRGAGTAKRSSKPRSSGYGSRLRTSTSSVQSLGGSPSLLNGTGDKQLISGVEGKSTDSLLGLPSPPQSRSSSADGSFLAGDPAVEDGADGPGELRGRPKSQESIGAKRHSGPKDAGKGNVLVSVRVRPDAASDENQPDGEWMVDGRRSLISYKGREAGDFRYDNVFSPHDNNSRVYDNAAKRLVRRVMEGYHGTVFAYGMTGTGKTFSMQGTATSPGVIPLAITDIFSYIRENPNREFLLRVSYLEIYNEKIYDLLNQGPAAQGQQEEIKLREDAKRGVYATPLKEEIVQSPNQLLRVISRGDLARRTGSTQFNQRSSRSHAVVQIVVESRARTPNHGAYFEKENRRNDKIMPGGVLVSTLSLIDLAGSERAAENKERRTEGAHINKSLLTLGTVIARLSGEDEKDKEEGGAKAADKEKSLKHLPYRDSKLTRLLQPALSGNSLVSILCTVQLGVVGSSASATTHTGETLNTLKFASRAKNNIVSHAKRNISTANANDPGSRALLDRYRMEIQELRAQLETQNKAKDEPEKHHEEVDSDRKIEEDLEKAEQVRHEEQMLEMQLARTALKERISHLNRLILSSKSLGVNSGRMSSLSSQTMPNGRSSLSASGDYGRPVSVRSRDSMAESTIRDSTVAPSVQGSTIGGDESAVLDDEEDARLEEGDASQTQQIRMLQADLSDKNRYIATLEKRLLQARRTSHSRVSMQLANRGTGDGGVESLLRDKDREIDELKAKLDDQVRMVNALRSAARKRETFEFRRSNMSDDTARPSTALSSHSGIGGMSRMSSRASARSLRLNNISHSSNPSRSSGGFQKTPLSPMALLSPTHSDKSDGPKLGDESSSARDSLNRRRSVDEMTMLLDQMIQEKVESGHVVHGDRGSLRIKRDTVMEKVEESNEGGENTTGMHKTTTSNGILTTPIEPIEEMSGGEQDQSSLK